MSITLKVLESNTSVGNVIHMNAGKLSTGYAYIITDSTRNIYSTAEKARNRCESIIDKNAMYSIKSGTAAKILKINNYNGYITVNIKCGSKTAWIYAGKLTNKNPNSRYPTFSWTKGPYLKFAGYDEAYIINRLGLKKSDIRTIQACENLSSNDTTINSRCIITGTRTEDNVAEGSNDMSSSSTASATMTANATNINTGEDETYDYAIKINPPYPYNILDHLGGNTEQAKNYLEQIDSNGINFRRLRNIFGMPYQFLPTTDCRVSANYTDNLEIAGYEFAEKILSRMPLLYITPGNTSFMGGSNENARGMLIGQIASIHKEAMSDDNALFETSLETMLGEYNGKLYTIMPAYSEYFSYVNPLCRAGAIFLDIAGSSLNDDGPKYGNNLISGKTTFANMNWGVCEGQAYELWKEEENTLDENVEDGEDPNSSSEESQNTETEETTKPKKAKFEEDYSEYFKKDENVLESYEKALYYGNAIAFYINSDSSFQDSFTNETTSTTLASTIDGLSDKAREIQFLIGTASSAVGEAFDKVDGTLSSIKTQIDNIVKSISGGNTIFTTIANSVKTIVSGGRMLFPQIWSNSTFSKSYNISIKLTTPSTDRISWWLNIYVPLCHLMALVLPRSEYINSYTTPFLIKAFYKGMFNIDMGIITEMTFNKGKEGSWTKDGLPTVVDVSFTIQDLYIAMGMTSTEKMFKGLTLQNVAEMDYIANLCGININEPDVFRMVNLWCAFNITNKVYDFIPNLSLGIERSIANSVINSYNNFWMN